MSDKVIQDPVEMTISNKEYLQPLEDSIFLECLTSAGVDNWEGYDEALKLFRESNTYNV